MSTETRTVPQRTDLPASKPPAAKPQPRRPYRASTADRDPFEVFGGDRLADDLDAMFGAE